MRWSPRDAPPLVNFPAPKLLTEKKEISPELLKSTWWIYILKKITRVRTSTLNAREMVADSIECEELEKRGGGGPHNHNIIYMRGQDYEGNHKRSLSQ